MLRAQLVRAVGALSPTTPSSCWGAVGQGKLKAYARLIKHYALRYGAQCWPLLYQVDHRCRSENSRLWLSEARRRHQADNTQPVGFDPNRPFNWVWEQMVEDKSYWAEEFVENAVMLLAKVSSGQLVVQGDATVGPSIHAEVSFGGSGSQPPPPGPPGPRRQPPPPGPPPDDGGRRRVEVVAGSRTPRNRGRNHDLSPGGTKYLKNRHGYDLCRGFGDGSCASNGRDHWCPQSWERVHQCDRCLAQDHAHCEKEVRANHPRSGRGGKGGKGGGAPPGKARGKGERGG